MLICVTDNGDSANVYAKLQTCHCVHKCNTIRLSSLCIAPVPKVESGGWVDVPMVKLGEQRVKDRGVRASVRKSLNMKCLKNRCFSMH